MNTKYLVFATKKETIDFLKSIEGLDLNSTGTYFSPNGVYYASHGESSRPTYEARRYKNGWGIHVAYCFFAGTCYAPADGRIDTNTFSERFIVEDEDEDEDEEIEDGNDLLEDEEVAA